VRLLLDTHALIWWIGGDPRIPSAVRAAIEEADNVKFVSAASAWEVATKHRLGKLPGAGPLAMDFERVTAAQGFVPLDISVAHALDAGNLPGIHRDPFDRVLIAQARAERLALVSNESLFDAYGVVRLW